MKELQSGFKSGDVSPSLSPKCPVENAGPTHFLCFGECDLKVLGGKSKEGVAWDGDGYDSEPKGNGYFHLIDPRHSLRDAKAAAALTSPRTQQLRFLCKPPLLISAELLCYPLQMQTLVQVITLSSASSFCAAHRNSSQKNQDLAPASPLLLPCSQSQGPATNHPNKGQILLQLHLTHRFNKKKASRYHLPALWLMAKRETPACVCVLNYHHHFLLVITKFCSNSSIIFFSFKLLFLIHKTENDLCGGSTMSQIILVLRATQKHTYYRLLWLRSLN